MKTKVLSLCRDMKTHNIGQYMTNGRVDFGVNGNFNSANWKPAEDQCLG